MKKPKNREVCMGEETSWASMISWWLNAVQEDDKAAFKKFTAFPWAV